MTEQFIATKYKKKLHLKKERENKPSEFYLKPAEVQKLINSAKTPRNRCLLKILAYTGMRRDELRGLEYGDINWEAKTVRIRNAKFGRERVVDVPDSVLSDLKFYLSNRVAGPLFPSQKGGNLTNVQINRIIADTGRLAGLENPDVHKKNINPHILRHSFVRNARKQGMDWEKIQKLCGHKSIKTTIDIYGSPDREDVSEAYHEKIANMYEDEH